MGVGKGKLRAGASPGLSGVGIFSEKGPPIDEVIEDTFFIVGDEPHS